MTMAAGCCGPVRGLYPPTNQSDVRDVYIYDNHWHTGFVLRFNQLSPTLQKFLSRFRESEYVEIGWGDEGFYRAPESTSGLAMRAMFFSRGSVLHVAGLDREPDEHYREFVLDLYRVRVSRAGWDRLMEFIERRFATDSRGDSIALQPGLYGVSYFYAARGNYSVFHTCNNWVADGLRSTGFPISPFYAHFADNVGWQIRTFGRRYQQELLVLHE
jgi:uncharacterized protein (TIGR02117 family)